MVFFQTPKVSFQAEVAQLHSHLIESHVDFKEQWLMIVTLYSILDTNVKDTL